MPFALRQLLDGDGDGYERVDDVVAGVQFAEHVEPRSRLVVRIRPRGVERDRVLGGGGLERVEHVLHAQLEVLRELSDGGGTARPGDQALMGGLDLECLLLGAARDVDRPPEVTEVALQLTQDRRYGEGGEGGFAVEVEAIDGLHQSEAGDLEQVVEGLARPGVAAGQVAGQGKEPLYELLASTTVLVLLPANEELAVACPSACIAGCGSA